jgi:hypothetical protein
VTTVTYLSFGALLLILFLVPGWLWLRRAGVEPVTAVYAGPGVVAAAAASIVALGVLLPWGVATTCVIGLVMIVVTSIFCYLTAPRPLGPLRGEWGGVVVFIVAFISLAAFSAPPSDPYVSWNLNTVGGGRVDTPRWPGLSSDNTLPYRTAQVAFFKQGGPQIRDGYAVGWWLSDRTPLTGLDFAFAAGGFGVHLSSANVEELPGNQVPMVVMDRYGFWAYQLTAMMLNLMIVLGVYLLARAWLERRVALVSALVAAVLPGLFLNAIYTWPKQAVAYFVLVAAACALRRRPVLAGAFASLGYLTHPAGVVWLLPVALLLLRDERLSAALRRSLLKFLAAAALLAAPWVYFTSQVMHATSRWTTAPLGYVMTDPRHLGAQLSIAWKVFVDNGLFYAVWVRAASTAGTVFPLDLANAPVTDQAGHYAPEALHHWISAHGFSVWGMVGIALFPFAVVALIRHWPQFRTVVLRFLLPGIVIAELANGELYPFGNQSMFVLVGVLAIVLAVGLLAVTRRARGVLVGLAALELTSMTFGALYRPYNIAPLQLVVFTAIAAIGEIALLVMLAIHLDVIRWRPSRSRLRVPRIEAFRAYE